MWIVARDRRGLPHFFPFLNFAHLALVAAIILALPSGLNWRLFLGAALAGAGFEVFTVAHLAFAAAFNFARCAAENLDFLGLAAGADLADEDGFGDPLKRAASSVSSARICSLI